MPRWTDPGGFNLPPALVPLVQVFCCCIPVSAIAPGLSRRTRLSIVAGWALLMAAGWVLSALNQGG
jgi:hypothetical protein